jgi:hypothetical protein
MSTFSGECQTELIHPRIFSGLAEAKTVIAEWIEVYSGPQKLDRWLSSESLEN